ncbi:MAG TPA: glycerophosphoryl diester phosphodiesterase membrane domain-containing protein [Candidatus Pacearchaeota archaeon]|nr:glycerophosphoryl diester phosphodiesterase membrane domain-containing protein [Candidatus Pacearchaeota archaeon]HQF83182.1 glycerophosphoryl diester phosphodiesterase membrane domain-containing protein [Candidatus Pacearchaeota archaeon]HQJ58112.1 glycerophosphoryl diester phosphodiesterase membrane domain-containing protein [Candidatus Pacearchaeota archaeon]
MEKQKRGDEDKFTFGSLFDKSVNEYKRNFKPILKLVLIFLGIILVLAFLFNSITLITDERIFNIMSNPLLIGQYNQGTIKLPIYYDIVSISLNIVYFFLALFVGVGLIAVSLKKDKFSYKEILENGKTNYWRYFGFTIVVTIFIMLLFLLLIIPGVIFAVYWVFAAYVFLEKKQKIIDSLKESKRIVKKRWWKTFGYMILFGLVTLAFVLILSIIKLPIGIPVLLKTISSSNISLGLLLGSLTLNLIYDFVIALVVTPMFILFLKNFYFEMKNSVKESPKNDLESARKKKKR